VLGWPLLPSYGATECASQIATAAIGSLEDRRYPPLRLLSHVEAMTDGEGFLRIRSPALFTGYAVSSDPREPDSVALIDPREEGWWTTEDRGSVTDDVLRVEGRTSDFVKIGGESVRVPALEAVLEEVRVERSFAGDAALLPVPDDRLGHVIVLVHAGASDDEAAALQTAFNARVAPFERARRTHRLPRLPRTPLGKLKRDETLRAVGQGRK
jgi:O-succinylbenzoic acid--CoA ligase